MTIQERLKYALQAGLHVLLYGPPGTGKSHLAWHSARQFANRDPFAIVVPEDCAVAELRGHYVPSGQEWQWHDGPVTSALRTGRPIILDEVSHASAEAHTFLHQAMDDSEVLTLPTGESIAKKRITVIATMNDHPDRLRPALRDRFAVTVEVPRPDPSVYAALRFGAIAERETTESLRKWVYLERAIASGIDMASAAELIFPGRGTDLVDAMTIASAPTV
jgi:nitric oxide reductase NorQ protein